MGKAVLPTLAIVALAAMLMAQDLPIRGNPAAVSPSAASPPQTYELQLNGETFLVEANRETMLESKTKPGVRYRVALRVSPVQRMRLNSVVLNYDLPAKVEDDGKQRNRSVRITHELGFSALFNDLGRPLNVREAKETLKMLTDSVTATLDELKAQEVNVTEPHERKFDGSAGRGATIRYRDAHGFRHVYLLYVLTGPKHAATCVIEYLEKDSDDVVPMIKRLLDSVRAAG